MKKGKLSKDNKIDKLAFIWALVNAKKLDATKFFYKFDYYYHDRCVKAWERYSKMDRVEVWEILNNLIPNRKK